MNELNLIKTFLNRLSQQLQLDSVARRPYSTFFFFLIKKHLIWVPNL